MSNITEEVKKDQADDLRKAVEELNDSQEFNSDSIQISKHKELEMDILNLPPRKDVHYNSKRMRLKLNFSLFRLIMVIIILSVLVSGILWIVDFNIFLIE
ncbi:hypothetical protein M3E13_06955 [Oceanobacillus kimchii]|uniref:hypothetical protein n=1 Tax=Oceanobacillus kimchii TaxID=746691 RepID=UPI0009857980|nr:hypothetical protein [Oceanobacillus kimchii]MCT1576013.1 hypothetical protein [Oceanobacillus kimchii]MCT2135650.1 hypothetical protein [Oceanobacillus kimchii]